MKQAIWVLTNFGRDKKMNDNTWFISDTHFSHANIIRYCNRPWNHGLGEDGQLIVDDSDVEAMNKTIVDNWNKVVGKDDIVWHLGDFSFGKKDNVEKYFKQLNGRINIVLGNHDKQKVKFYYDVGFHRVYDRPVIINNFFILSHEPLQWVQNPMYNIFGHIHDNPIYKTWSNRGCCVCVERHDYTPISWKEIMNHIKKEDEGD